MDCKMLGTFQFPHRNFWLSLKNILQQDRLKWRREWESRDTNMSPTPTHVSSPGSITFPLLSMLSSYLDFPLTTHLLPIVHSHCTFLEMTIFISAFHRSSFHTPCSKNLTRVQISEYQLDSVMITNQASLT